MKASIAAKLNVFKTNIYGTCPGGFCDYIQAYSEVLVVILCLDGFIFFVTLLPPLFNWSTKKSDGRKRIYFAALACFTFYFWLAFLLINSIYCFGFLAHLGPCNATQNQQASATLTPSRTPTSNGGTPSLTTTSMPTFPTLPESSLERPASTQSAPKLLASTSMATRFSSLVTSMEPSRPSSRSSSSWASRDPTSAFTFSPSSFTRVEPDKGSSSVSSFSSSVSGSPTSSSSFSSSSSSSNVGVNSEAGLSMSEMASSTRIVVLDDLHGALTTGAEAAAASVASTEAQEVLKQQQQPQAGVPMALISWTSSDKANSSCVQLANEHETQLKNLTLVNVLILVVLFIVFIANAKEAMSAKALFHKETLCKREEVQRFLSSLVLKPPEVGHLINCFHTAKTNTDTRNKKANMAAAAANLGKKDGKDAGPPRKVVTFSAIENFTYQTWRDFSDVRLIEPSSTYPIIEIEVMLNFFPGDHYTAERYKAFVNQMTKTHSGKDQRITIDDYFHVEDHREWTFFIGKESHITPWWDKDAAKIPLSCIFFLGWPFRLAYGGRIAKHKVEVKKAVFVENNSADEGVSLSATPGSDDNANANTNGGRKPSVVVEVEKDSGEGNEVDEAIDEDDETQAMLETSKNNAAPAVISTASSSNHEQFTEHRVNAVVSQPPKEAYPMASTTVATVSASAAAASGAASDHHYFYQQMQMGPSVPTTRKTPQQQQQMPAFGHPLANVMPLQSQPPVAAAAAAALQQQPPPAPQRRTAPLRTLREKDVVVTHQDINGVNTVALKDIDVQMTAMSGYETYV